MQLHFCDPRRLRPTEAHDPAVVRRLHHKIGSDECWLQPLLVHAGTLAVLDGHHRREVALLLGLDFVPCLLGSYDGGMIELSSWRPEFSPTPDSVIAAALTGSLFPIKTTRHVLKAPPRALAIPLELLRRSAFLTQDDAGRRPHAMPSEPYRTASGAA